MTSDGVYNETDGWEEAAPAEDRDFSKMRLGLKVLDNAIADLGTYKQVNRNYGSKSFILHALDKHDYATLREVSRYFYESSGIYKTLCDYMAYLFKYDWYVTPYIDDLDKEKEEKILKEFSKVLLYLDRSDIKRVCGDIALQVMVDGAYYGILMDFGDRFGM